MCHMTSKVQINRGPYDSLPHHYLSFRRTNIIAAKEKQKGIYFKVSEKGRNLIEQKMALAGVHNMSAFIRKMSIDGYVINLEIPELAECEKLLRYISNNANQIARTLNSSGAVYPEDVGDICAKQDEANQLFGEILEQLSRLK